MNPQIDRNAAGIAFILAGVAAISVNDMLIKQLSGSYPLHQMVFIRSALGLRPRPGARYVGSASTGAMRWALASSPRWRQALLRSLEARAVLAGLDDLSVQLAGAGAGGRAAA